MLAHWKFHAVICIRGAVLIILIWMAYFTHLQYKNLRYQKVPGIVYMLQWTPAFTDPFASMGEGVETFIKRKCPVKNCYVTGVKDLLGDITDFDVLLFDAKEIVSKDSVKMPEKRKCNQKYVFASMESAGFYPIFPVTFYQFFNLTWTYKLGSDIYFGYFVIKNRNGELIGPSEDIQWMSQKEMSPTTDSIKRKIANKTIAAAWFVSNCRAPTKKHRVVKEIQLAMKEYGMSLDVYGACGNKRCPPYSINSCLKLLETDYYFYFAFENSFAEDYVSDKLMHALKNYAVPVVFGGADYKRFMPDGIYLDATRLKPAELVRQMFQLINEPNQYSEFFKWHNHYSYHDLQESPDTDPFCKLCDYINIMQLENRSSVIYDLEDWWNPHAEQWMKFYNTYFSIL